MKAGRATGAEDERMRGGVTEMLGSNLAADNMGDPGKEGNSGTGATAGSGSGKFRVGGSTGFTSSLDAKSDSGDSVCLITSGAGR